MNVLLNAIRFMLYGFCFVGGGGGSDGGYAHLVASAIAIGSVDVSSGAVDGAAQSPMQATVSPACSHRRMLGWPTKTTKTQPTNDSASKSTAAYMALNATIRSIGSVTLVDSQLIRRAKSKRNKLLLLK